MKRKLIETLNVQAKFHIERTPSVAKKNLNLLEEEIHLVKRQYHNQNQKSFDSPSSGPYSNRLERSMNKSVTSLNKSVIK
mmetsp:Transcript_13790/g.12223  ORF Transcript_13790/g.12223 Transcript_13790/m.12223 type:complete len:80 (+) Transcript_13790:214-453(+)